MLFFTFFITSFQIQMSSGKMLHKRNFMLIQTLTLLWSVTYFMNDPFGGGIETIHPATFISSLN